MTYTPDQIARAREIYASFKRWGSGSPFWDDIRKGLTAGVFDSDGDMKAILAAIAATEAHVTERACEYLESVAAKRSDHMKIAALRNNEHLREPGA